MVRSGTRNARAISPWIALQQAQGEGNPGFGREHRMAGYEDQAQQIVPDVVV